MSNLDAALSYAARGWRVHPLRFNAAPWLNDWPTLASTDPDTIRQWWATHPGAGVGIATGAASGIWVLDVDTDRRRNKFGDDTLTELVDAYGPLPDTYTVITGSGGLHHYFAWPADGTEIRNDQSGTIGAHLDVRGEGGYVVAPPTAHRIYGTPFERELSSPDDVAEAPGWLVALATKPTRTDTAPREPRPTDRGLPGDEWMAAVTWDDLLTADGWTKLRAGYEGEDRWCRPGKDAREGPSATVGYKGSDVLKVFTSSLGHLGLQAEATYSKLGYLAATRYGGDHAAAARWCRLQGYGEAQQPYDPSDLLAPAGTPTAPLAPTEPLPIAPPLPVPLDTPADELDEPADWAPQDLTTVLDGTHEAPAPTIATPHGTNAIPLFYDHRVNTVFGESGAGKTWLALVAVADCLDAGHHATYIDLEDSAHGVVTRLQLLGVDRQAILDRFHYLSPQTAWSPAASATMARLIAEVDPELVVLDSTGEAMAAGGVKGNDDDDVARWFVTFPKAISRQGPAVVVIDHVPKDPNSPATYAIGSQRKIAAVDGAAYRVDAVSVPSRTEDGLLKIITAKDRHGARSKGSVAAMLRMTHLADGVLSTVLEGPDPAVRTAEGKFRPTIYMERISRYLEANPGLSGRAIEERVEGKGKTLRDALACLIEEGHVGLAEGRGWSYVVSEPYRSDTDPLHDEPVDNSNRVPRVPPRPTASRTRPRPPRPASPPLRGGRGVEGRDRTTQTANRVPPVDNSRDADIDPLAAMFTAEGER